MFETLIKNIAKGLRKKKIPYMIIGGQAVLLYGTPRLTKDIDITLGADIDRISAIENLCGELKLKILPGKPREFAAKTMVLPAEDPATKIRVDFIFSFSDYEKEAIKRAVKVKIGGCGVYFASIEDLIIHKIFAGRAVDLEDVGNVLMKKSVTSINITYIKKWLNELQRSAYKTDMPAQFNKILAGAKRKG